MYRCGGAVVSSGLRLLRVRGNSGGECLALLGELQRERARIPGGVGGGEHRLERYGAQSAFADACRPGNPRDTSVEEIKELYRSLL